MNTIKRRSFLGSMVALGAVLMDPLRALAFESPEDRVQRLIDATLEGGTVVIYGSSVYRNPSWVVSQRKIKIDGAIHAKISGGKWGPMFRWKHQDTAGAELELAARIKISFVEGREWHWFGLVGPY